MTDGGVRTYIYQGRFDPKEVEQKASNRRHDHGDDPGEAVDRGRGPLLGYADAAAFLAELQPLIDKARKRRIN